jgi:hypothetical protein
MWRCRKRWNRPVLKSGSALKIDLRFGRPYLSTAIARKRIVPQSLMWTGQWLLVVIMVAMSSNSRSKAQKSRSKPHHTDFVSQEEEVKKSGELEKMTREPEVNSCGKLARPSVPATY